MSRPRSVLVSAIGRIGGWFARTRIGRIPGAKAIYRLLIELAWLWPSETIVKIEGSKMYLNPRERSPMRTAFRAYLRAAKEPLTTKMFKGALSEGNVVVDIGANIGYFTLLASRLVGKSGRVYAFEPEPTNWYFLRKNIELNRYDNVFLLQKAVSSAAGISRLYTSGSDTGAHTLRRRHARGQFSTRESGESIEVETVTLDEFFEHKEPSIDLIKIDAEGAEMGVVSGMDHLIRKNRHLKMIVEFYPGALREMGHAPEEFARKLIHDHGFSIVMIDELRQPTNQLVEITSVAQLMTICSDEEKIVNLFLKRGPS